MTETTEQVTPAMVIEKLRTRVAEWSLANFEAQQSKFDPNVNLGHLAPLLGVAEELGELAEAIQEHCMGGQKDAIGDILVYMCDFASRLDINFEEYTVEEGLAKDLTQEIGALFHHVLKMHQGIRGYQNKDFAIIEIRDTIFSIFDVLHDYCNSLGIEPPFTLATETFDYVVSLRDWKTNPTTGD